MVSSRVYNRIDALKCPTIEMKKVPMEQANGSPLDITGTAKVEMQMGNYSFQREVLISDIKDDVLLGLDVGEKVDVISSQNKVYIDGLELPCMHVGGKLFRIVAADTYTIAGEMEQEIEVYVGEEHNIGRRLGEVLLEASPEFCQRFPLVAARSIVDLSSQVAGRMRMINPYKEDVVIRQNTTIGHAEELDGLEYLCWLDESEENSSDKCGHDKPRNGSCGSQERLSGTAIDTDNGTENHLGMRCSKVTRGNLTDSSSVDSADSSAHTEHLDVPKHLHDNFLSSSSKKSKEERQEIKEVLLDFQDVFSVDDNDLGCTHLANHAIDTGDSRPIKQCPRRVPSALSHEEEEAIQKMRAQGVVRESSSPWSSRIVLVRKKTGEIRPCIDYRKINSLTKKDAYPIPRTQDCLDALSGSVMFSTLDMTSGYFQVPIREEDIPKTAFVTRHGLWEFTTMPFGLTNAPATFQRVMELAMRGLQWTSCLIYLDDVIIFGRTFQEHTARLRKVLERIRQANLKLKPRKCDMFQEQVRFLGHIVAAEGIRPDPNNISKITGWSEPKTVTEVRQFLGLCSYYRRFVRNFSIIAKPLTKLTTNDSELLWSTECQSAFDELKARLVGPEVMAFPRDDGTYILDTDACNIGIGSVLSQVQDGKERVIAYASRSLNKSEKNYCVTDKELLAVKYFVEYFRYHLLGRQFTIRTDHQAIKWLFTLKEPKGRIQRWIEILSAYNFDIEYRPGNRHGNADGLSRCPNPRDCHCHEQDNMESLKCGPCKKCQKRSMESDSNSPAGRVQNITCTKIPGQKKTEGQTPLGRRVIWKIFYWISCIVNVLRMLLSVNSQLNDHANSLSKYSSWEQGLQDNPDIPVEDDGRMRGKSFSR